MTGRDRFHRALAGEPTSPPLWGEGIREDVREAWKAQGVPRDRDLDAEFSIDRREQLQPDVRSPRFTIVGPDKDADDPDEKDPARYPDDWENFVARNRDRSWPLGLRIFSGLLLTLGVGEWKSMAPVMLAVADRPDWVADRMDEAAKFSLGVLERAFDELEFDHVVLSEPIASSAAPVVGPHTLRRTCGPAYRRLVAAARARGVKWIVFQSYGNVRPLLHEAAAAGCNVFWIGETYNTGISYEGLRKQFPQTGLVGGILAELLLEVPEMIRREVLRIVPALVRGGRCIPLLDGRVRDHVPFEHYAAYRRALLEAAHDTSLEG